MMRQDDVQRWSQELGAMQQRIQERLAAIEPFDDGSLIAMSIDTVFESLVLSRDGKILDVNDAFLRLVQLGAVDDVVGRQVTDFVAAGERRRVRQRVSGGLAGPYFTRIKAASGEEIPVEVRVEVDDTGLRKAAIRRHHGASCPMDAEGCPLRYEP